MRFHPFLLESFATKNNENIDGCKKNWYNKKYKLTYFYYDMDTYETISDIKYRTDRGRKNGIIQQVESEKRQIIPG